MKKLALRRSTLYFGAPLLLAAAVTASVVGVRAQSGGNPEAGLTDAQRQALHQTGMARSPSPTRS